MRVLIVENTQKTSFCTVVELASKAGRKTARAHRVIRVYQIFQRSASNNYMISGGKERGKPLRVKMDYEIL
jgi:hypothetical protein